jgi:hypothetical protein
MSSNKLTKIRSMLHTLITSATTRVVSRIPFRPHSPTLSKTQADKEPQFHTLNQPVYSSFLQDGDEFETLSNETVRVSILNGDIYFNDALVLKPNVLTNNGLMYEIDRVMSPLSTAGSGSSSSATPSATSVSSSSSSGPATVTVTASPAPSATPSSGAASGHQVPVLEALGFLTSLICAIVI